MTVKTLFLFEEMPEISTFFELEGDYTRFNDIYINATGPKGKAAQAAYEKLTTELSTLVYDPETGNKLIPTLDAPTKDWTHFVKCGMIL